MFLRKGILFLVCLYIPLHKGNYCTFYINIYIYYQSNHVDMIYGLWGCKLNCVIFIFDSTVGDRPSAKGVHQHSRRA